MSGRTLPLLVSLVTLVSAVVTAPASCPISRLCVMVCNVSPQLAARCEACHPGVCSGEVTEVKPATKAVRLGPPNAKSSADTDGAVQKKPEAPQPPGESVDNDNKEVYSPVASSIDEDDEPPTTQPGAPEESVEDDDEDIPIEGNGVADEEGPEPAGGDAGFQEETIENAADSSDEEAAPKDPKPEKTEPENTESKEADPEQTEPEEKEPEKAEIEAPESSEAEGERPEVTESKPEEIEAEKPESQDAVTEEPLPKEPKPEAQPEEVRSDETQKETEDAESAEESPEDEFEEDADDDSQLQKPAEIPEPDVDSSENPKKNESDQPKHESKEAAPEVSEDSAVASATPSSRFFAPSASRSALACLHDGTYHPLHSTWFDMAHCNLYVCTINGVQTTSLMGACKPPPANMSQCRRYRLPNQCCYSYDCQSDGGDDSLQPCIDSFGVERPHNDHWVDNPDHPCVRFFCVDGVVVVLSDMRPLCPVPPSHGCTAFQPDDMCCNDFNCTSAPTPLACLDQQGTRRDNGQIWYDNDVIPCRKFLCNNGTIQLLVDHSASCSQSPGAGCVSVPVSGRCCPTFDNCSCIYQGQEFLSGAMFPDDPTFPCRRLQCDNGTIVTVDERVCQPLTCSPTFRRPGSCCYECAGCVHGGVHRPEGSFWYNRPQQPCILFTCTNSQVVAVNRTQCPGSPGPHCQPIITPGECCATYDCSAVTCPYGDQIYQEGDVWVDNPVYPCKWFTCRRTGVQQVNNTYCPALVPRDCPSQRDPGECCYSCQTVAPVTCHYRGQTYQEGDVWVDNPVYPCKWFTCRRTGVQQVNNTYCPALVPRDCPSQRDPGECCYSCQTDSAPDCVDENGVVRESGDVYYIDPERCVLARCVRDEQELVLNRTELCPSPPSSNCSAVGLVNCCPQYLCHEMPTSNCTDSTGRLREEGEIYANDEEGCLLVQCVEGAERLLVDLSSLCPPPDVDPDTCIQTGSQNCCPVYHCSGPVNCVDGSGTQHSEGDMYYDDSTNCVLVECSGGEEVIVLDKTEQCDPPPENPACTVQETVNCCPVYNCPDCTYNGTTYPVGARWWDDLRRQCVWYRCSSHGLVVEVLTRLPCAEVRFGCVPVRDEPACCHHKYNCMFDYEHNLIPMTELPF